MGTSLCSLFIALVFMDFPLHMSGARSQESIEEILADVSDVSFLCTAGGEPRQSFQEESTLGGTEVIRRFILSGLHSPECH